MTTTETGAGGRLHGMHTVTIERAKSADHENTLNRSSTGKIAGDAEKGGTLSIGHGRLHRDEEEGQTGEK